MPLIQPKPKGSFLDDELKLYAKVKDRLQSYVKDAGGENKIHPEFVAATINDLAPPDTVFTVDTGMTCVWAARYLSSTGARDLLGSFNHGSMANALPQAIGAALCAPERTVVALCGDGGLSMTTGDLATIAQYKLPVKVIVFNNRSLGMVKLEMEVAGLPDWQTDMHNPDFAMLAQAYGLPGITISQPDKVKESISQALSQPGPILLNIMTDPNALAMPPKIQLAQVRGMAASMTKLMLNGEFEEVWETIKSNIRHAKELL